MLARRWGLVAVALVLFVPSSVQAAGTVLVGQRLPRSGGASPGRYAIYLPEGYDAACTVRYPWMILLHGLGGDGVDWFDLGHANEALDGAIAAGSLPPVVVVAPDGGNGYWTNWVDGHHRYGDLVVRDLVAHVERTWCVQRQPRARWIAGLSAGGFGALSLALRHPDTFGAVGSFSGALFLEPPTHRKVYGRLFGRPPDPARFAALEPIHLVRAGAPVPELVYVDCGDDDPLGFLEGALALHAALRQRGLAHELRVRDGRHTWPVWRAAFAEWLQVLGRFARRHGVDARPAQGHPAAHDRLRGTSADRPGAR